MFRSASAVFINCSPPTLHPESVTPKYLAKPRQRARASQKLLAFCDSRLASLSLLPRHFLASRQRANGKCFLRDFHFCKPAQFIITLCTLNKLLYIYLSLSNYHTSRLSEQIMDSIMFLGTTDSQIKYMAFVNYNFKKK